MGPKKRDKVPIRRPISYFSYPIPLGTPAKYAHMKAAIGRRLASGNGMPRGLPSPEELREKAKREREKDEGGGGLGGDGGEGGGEEGSGGKNSKKKGGGAGKDEASATTLPDLESRYNSNEVARIQANVAKLSTKKKDFFWLLKQVITVEAQRKRTEVHENKGSGGTEGSAGTTA
eukprot:CAMPEP_0182465136 /NCGR_PEP_ID=MMETSP1319-20130603/9018_1 /TAXON_ID=172717 /ORGANISM="Bolidomonas pacifica, Strain RCC208" /LENGTH=174 /DNA_ID=CAMNT_0024664825 /DNA_START=280 /DNA_END=801 /DNA_ORIENTATION=+